MTAAATVLAVLAASVLLLVSGWLKPDRRPGAPRRRRALAVVLALVPVLGPL